MKLLEFKLFVLEPTLQFMGMHSLAAERLMLGTIAHESQGQHLDQRLSGDDTVLGPAFGVYQIETATHDDIFKHVSANTNPSNIQGYLSDVLNWTEKIE